MEEKIPAMLDALLQKYHAKTRLAGAQNAVVKHVRGLTRNTKPNPRRFFVAEGIWTCGLACKSNIKIVNAILATECIHSLEAFQIAEELCARAEDVNLVSKKVFQSISERGEPDGLMAVCVFPEYVLASISTQNAVVLVLDGLEIPGNVGTIIRSADAAGADAVFLVNRKARLTHPKLLKGSMGSVFTKPVIEFDSVSSCREWLNRHGFTVYLADTRAEKTYYQHSYQGNTALILGSERYGISREWYDGQPEMLSIPMMGDCDSLNVAIAGTVILYEIMLKKQGWK